MTGTTFTRVWRQEIIKTQVARHLLIGIRAMEQLRDMPLERIHSRKLRSFYETAFL